MKKLLPILILLLIPLIAQAGFWTDAWNNFWGINQEQEQIEELIQQVEEPTLGATLLFPHGGGSGKDTSGWGTSSSAVCLQVTDGIWGTTTCGVAAAGDSDWTEASSTAIYSSSSYLYVGIGTTTPAYLLDVWGDTFFSGSSTMKDLDISGGISLIDASDSYIKFNAGVDYLLWDDGGDAFFFSNDVTTNGLFTGGSLSITASSSVVDLNGTGNWVTTGNITGANINPASSTAWDSVYGSSTAWDSMYASSSFWDSVYASSSAWDDAYATTIASSSEWSQALASTSILSTKTITFDFKGVTTTGVNTSDLKHFTVNKLAVAEIGCNTDSGTTSATFFEALQASPNASSAEILNTIVGTTTIATTSSFTDASIAARAWIVGRITGITNATDTFCYMRYQIDD